MKKYLVFSVLSLILAIVWGGQVAAQNPEVVAKPSFIALTPGQYVHGWPAFTVSYPKEWAVQPLFPGEVFRVGAPRPSLPPLPILAIAAFLNPADISGSANILAGVFRQSGGKDIKVLYTKPSQLQDGTPAQESEIEWVLPNGVKFNTFLLVTKKDNIWILVDLHNDQGMIGDDLKRIVYSLKVPQGKDESVEIPRDVRDFLDKWCADVVSHDADRIMANFSDQFLNSGAKKAGLDQFFRNNPFSPIQRGTISCEPTVTVFEAQGDKAYVDGFNLEKSKGDANPIKMPMSFQQIIKENDQWKWYGNQK